MPKTSRSVSGIFCGGGSVDEIRLEIGSRDEQTIPRLVASRIASEMTGQREIAGRKLMFGAAAMGLGSALKVALQLVMLPLMARLLGPQEFGLYALAMPTVMLVQMLADGGLGTSLSRGEDPTEVVWSTAFWLLHALCGLLALAIVGWSIPLAHLSHQARLPGIMAALSLSLLLLASTVLPSARLTREARMVVGPIADVTSSFAGASAGVILALNHGGAWSLVAQYLVNWLVTALILNAASPRLPRFHFRPGLLLGHIAAGGFVVGGKLSDFLGKLVENTLVSRSLGAATLGVYSLGNQVPRFLCEAVGNPLWHALYIQAIRMDPEAVKPTFYRFNRLLGLALIPATLLISTAAPEFVPLLLGPAWKSAVPVIALILPSYAIAVIGAQTTALLYAYGRSDISLWVTSAYACARIAAVMIAPLVGLRGVIIGIAIVNVIYGCASLIVPARILGLEPWLVAKDLRGALVSGVAAAAVNFLMLRFFPPGLEWVVSSCLVSGGICLGVLFLVDRQKLTGDIAMVRRLISQS
jgi:O-antigen/teichoic acid export membrane protein